MKKEKCLRCGHQFVKRINKPKVCPKCHSPYWNKARKVKNAI